TLLLAACTPLGSFELDEPMRLEDELPPPVDEPEVPDLADITVAPPLSETVELAWEGETDDPADAQWTDAGELPQLRAFDGGPLPLRHTDVHAEVRGHVADVVVRQTFINDRMTPID